jgi:biopolymer transport protein ExbB/TolQ
MNGAIIYGLLAILATYGNYILIWRTFLLLTTRLADAMSLELLLADLRTGRPLAGTYLSLGWLKSIVARAEMSNLSCMRRDVETFRDTIDRHHDTLTTISNSAMGLGFLGTVAALARPVVGKVDPVLMIGLGMMTTLVGLLIALPGAFFHGMTNRRVERFLEQVDGILEALDARPRPATAAPKTVTRKPAALEQEEPDPPRLPLRLDTRTSRETARSILHDANGERHDIPEPAADKAAERVNGRSKADGERKRRESRQRTSGSRTGRAHADLVAVDEVLRSTSCDPSEFSANVMHWIEEELDEKAT